MAERFLDKVYDLEEASQTEALYADFADRYEAEVAEAGYITPERCAQALAEFMGDPAAPVLDMGCGTGLSGLALRASGFDTIDGLDLTDEMLARAAEKHIYRDLRQTDAADPLPFEPGTHAHVAAIGLFSPSHAPASTIDEVLTYLPSGGCFVFSLNDHALEDPSYEGAIMNWADHGAVEVLFREHGPHLPGEDLFATVYVLRRR